MNLKLDDECRYKDLCEEVYVNDKDFVCTGTEKCEHFDAFLEGECMAEW